jgi:hypothetical protein
MNIDFTILTNDEARIAIIVLLQNTSLPPHIQKWGIDFISIMPEEKLSTLKGVITNLIKAAEEKDISAISQELERAGIPKVFSILIAPKIIQSIEALEEGKTPEMIIPPHLLRVINVNSK